jgi:hypothetical protein
MLGISTTHNYTLTKLKIVQFIHLSIPQNLTETGISRKRIVTKINTPGRKTLSFTSDNMPFQIWYRWWRKSIKKKRKEL